MQNSVLQSSKSLEGMQQYFASGATMSYKFRLNQLKRFKATLQHHEEEICKALYDDLRKSKTEAYLTELGLVISEISKAIKNLHHWMRPERVATTMINFPSSSYLYPHPKGTVLIIGTWNYPIFLSLQPVIGAMAGGNCIVLKPSEHATATANILEKIIKESFDENYFRVVQGDGGVVVPELMNEIRFDHVFFTGGTKVGKAIYEMAASKLIPVTLELGGKSPVIVEADANIECAAKRIALGKFMNAGQTCVAPDYVLVHKDKQQQLIAALKKAILNSFGENAQDSVDYCRIINKRRFDTLVSMIEETDGTIVAGGQHDADDLFIAPTLINDVSLSSRIMEEEIFGPILPIISFDTREEAMKIISKNKNPLAFYLFTSSSKVENEWLEKVAFGSGCINNTLQHLGNPNLPFGGIGNSGIGSYRGQHSFKEFTHTRGILKTPIWMDPFFKYPPFGNKLKFLRRLI